MALPNLSHADLEKLKMFINFVSENPAVLNMPQLVFVKDFIEKFGGKVPAGEFKMPAGATGGKCPFGGDAQSASASASASAEASSGMNVDESDEESESESESEVELDMEAQISQQAPVDNTSAVFLEEAKCFGKVRNNKTPVISTKMEKEDDDYGDDDEELVYNVEPILENSDLSETQEEDPIETLTVPKLEVEDDDDDKDYQDDENMNNSDQDEDSTSSDDEPLRTVRPKRKITTRQSKTRRRRRGAASYIKPKKSKKPRAISCGFKCKHCCIQKFTASQRVELCKEFWALNYVDRKNYLLAWIELKPLGPMRSVKTKKKDKRKHTNHYFLRDADGQRVRVCMTFFQSTLSIGNHQVKDAITNSDGKGNYLGGDMRGGSGAGRQARLDAIEKSKAAAEAAAEVEAEVAKAEHPTNIKLEIAKQLPVTEATSDTPTDVTAPNVAVSTECITVEVKPPKFYGWNKGRKLKKDRAPQPVKCAESCKWKCHTNFDEEQRGQICSAFWEMSYKRRKDFVLSRIETYDISSTTAEEYRKSNRAKRTFTNRYFFRGTRGNVRVCAHFFMATLCIGRQFINNAQKNIDKQTGAYAGEDKRGRHAPTNKISEETKNEIRRHIESYPTWMPHKNYKRRFLHSSLSVSKMYSEYKKQCETEQRKPVSSTFFAKIFHKDFRLSFLKPASKHAHKVSPNKKVTTPSDASNVQAEEVPRKINPNISEFTGEEGGFWINPNSARGVTNVQPQYPPHVQVIEVSNIPYAQPTAVTYNSQSGYYHHRGFQPAPSYEESGPSLQLL